MADFLAAVAAKPRNNLRKIARNGATWYIVPGKPDWRIGIAYSADGKHLVFSRDNSNGAIAQVTVPADRSFIAYFPNARFLADT